MKQESLKVRCLCLATKTQNPSLKALGRKAPSYSQQGQPLYSLYSSLLLMEWMKATHSVGAMGFTQPPLQM